MEEEAEKLSVGKIAANFAEYYGKRGNQDELIAVFGHKEAGKSVLIDLLAGKQLKQLYNSEIGSTIVVRKDDQNHIYPAIHTQKAAKQTFLECFTIQEDIQKAQLTTELIKLQLLQLFTNLSSKLSLVLLIQDSQLSKANLFIQRFLHCIGIIGNEKQAKVNLMKGYVGLIVTKAEGSIDDTCQILTELSQEVENENVKEIVAHLINDSAISHFQIKAPTKDNGVASSIKKVISPRTYKKEEFLEIFSRSGLREEAASDQKAMGNLREFKEAVKKLTTTNESSNAKPKPKTTVKKGPFYNFKQAIQQKCSTNKQAIEFCLTTIKDKQRQQKYDYFDVIHYIKLLRDLLEEYDSQGSVFRKQLLELALYTEDYYDFESHLKMALINKELSEKDATEWTKLLFSLDKYEYCEQIVDYLIAETINDDNFQRLVYFKAVIKGNIHAEFDKKGENDKKGESDKTTKKRELGLKLSDILSKKGRGRQLESYLQGKSYEQHIA